MRFALPRAGALFALALVVMCFGLSAVMPPFQSPDEFDHVKRAYLLTRGQIVLDAPAGQSSGGFVDTGLLRYMDAYGPIALHRERTLRAGEHRKAQGIRWSGIGEFSSAPGTGFYLPLIYAPQALGLGLGQALGKPIATAYRWSRMFALLASAGLILLAFSIYTPPPLALGLLLMPMSLFQMSSATIDGLSAALTMLALSCFMRIVSDKEGFRPWHFHVQALTLAVLVSSRIHALPLVVLPLAACMLRHLGWRRWAVAVAVIVFVLAWTVIAAGTTVQLGAGPDGSKASAVMRYVADPLSFLRIVGVTLMDPVYAAAYRYSFVGVLGWLDAAFPLDVYRSVSIALCALLAVSIAPLDWRRTGLARCLLALCAVGSFLLVFFAMLITWSPEASPRIEGVQGRYFLLPALMLAYASAFCPSSERRRRRAVSAALLFVLLLLSYVETIRLLLDRYYLA